jgi:hypothetical protein
VSLDGFAEGHRLARAIGWLIPVAMLVLVFVVLVGAAAWCRRRTGTRSGYCARLQRLEYSSGKRRYALAGDYSRL